MQVIPYMLTGRSIVLRFDDGTKVIPAENPAYERIKKLLSNHQFDRLRAEVDLALNVKMGTKGKFTVENDIVFVDGGPMPKSLSKVVISFAQQGIPYEPLLKFWKNLKKNPSKDSRDDLFTFLEHSGIPITEDGCFIAYKNVRGDFRDIHSGTFDNSPGKTPKMDRKDVDPDRNNCCSRGLHTCAYSYLGSYSSCQGHRVIEVKVNPQHVVAVPTDYGHAKMRVCEYTVVRECVKERDETLYQDDKHLPKQKPAKKPVAKKPAKKAPAKKAPAKKVAKSESKVDKPLLVKIGNRTRVRVPAELLQGIGAFPGKPVYCRTLGASVLLSCDKSAVEFTYYVNPDGALKIGKNVLEKAFLGSKRLFKIKLTNNKLVITGVN